MNQIIQLYLVLRSNNKIIYNRQFDAIFNFQTTAAFTTSHINSEFVSKVQRL